MSTPEDPTAVRAGYREDDRRAQVAEILRESEERTEEAADAVAPGDAADEHRTSAETAD
jgi:hypothetical protein